MYIDMYIYMYIDMYMYIHTHDYIHIFVYMYIICMRDGYISGFIHLLNMYLCMYTFIFLQ
jgi:hypothetical protein